MMALCSKAFIAALLFVAMVLPQRALGDAEEDWRGRPYVYLTGDVRDAVYQINVLIDKPFWNRVLSFILNLVYIID